VDAEVSQWTCARCGVTASWSPEVEQHERPAQWSDEGGELYCLACRRAIAAEAGAEAGAGQDSDKSPAQLRSAALIEFEIRRDPHRANGEIARACRSSVSAVVSARRRMGATQTPD
jgi:hypothetical protein